MTKIEPKEEWIGAPMNSHHPIACDAQNIFMSSTQNLSTQFGYE